MRLGRISAFKIKAFASHGHFLNTLGVLCCLTLCYRNPRAASLRLAERHNFGSPTNFFSESSVTDGLFKRSIDQMLNPSRPTGLRACRLQGTHLQLVSFAIGFICNW